MNVVNAMGEEGLTDQAQIAAVHRRYLQVETTVGVVINSLVGWAIFAGLIGSNPHMPLWGGDGLATALTRARVRKGRVPVRSGSASTRWPRNVLLRSVVGAMAATLIGWPITIALLGALGPDIWTFWPLFIFKTIYGMIVPVIVVPWAVTIELRR